MVRPDDERSLQQQPDDRSLVVRSEQTSLDNLSRSPYLAEAGFSPQFPEILMRLNKVLPEQGIKRISFELHPGPTPQIDAKVEHTGGYRLLVNAYPETQRTEIMLTGSERTFRIDDIKDFVCTNFPDRTAKLHAGASPHLIEPIEDFDGDLEKVTEELLRTWFEEKPAHESSLHKIGDQSVDYPYRVPSAEVKIEGQKYPLFCLMFLRGGHDYKTVGCEISNRLDARIPAFYYSGKPEEIERIMEGLVKLFDKPYLYPFQYIPEPE
jgi:hypothetical protein